MRRDYPQVVWDELSAAEARALARRAIQEDLGRAYDWTTVILVPDGAPSGARVVARRAGVVAGLPAAAEVVAEYDPTLNWQALAQDGDLIEPGATLARVSGSARSLLTAERTILNVLGRLCGVATLTASFVRAVAGTQARIYDTRKTMPGWRRLEKYAVRMGGGHNHRLGLADGILIKDNHLALGREVDGAGGYSPAEAVTRVRDFLGRLPDNDPRRDMLIEIEVDSLEQLDAVLPVGPDLVLLDNMSPETMREAVGRRDAGYPAIEIEASGGVNLSTVAAIAQSGVDRISVGALTHSAPWFDVGLDWE